MKVVTDRGTFGVRRVGDPAGPAVVLLHPLALDARFWDPVATELGQRFDVLALDARGHGGSEWDGDPFGVPDMADDLAAVLDACSIESTGVVGMSMGGCAAIAFAAGYPHRVRHLTLADTTSCYGPQREQQWAERAAQAVDVPRADQLGFQLGRWFTDEFRADEAAEVARVVDIFLATQSQVHAQACLALGDFDGRRLLDRITAPTSIFVGDQDQATPVTMAQELHRGIGHSTMEILRGLRHFGLVERPAVWPRLSN